MDLTGTQGTFNLLEEKWIPVLYVDGKTDRLGIIETLKEAGRIRQIAASNPMDRVALPRFLMAVLLWCKENAKSSLAELEERGADIPGDWLVKLEEHRAAFDLLGDGERFYQDKTLPDGLLKAKQKKWDDHQRRAKKKKDPKTRPTGLDHEDFRPIGDLLIEFPTETKIAHFSHVRDKEYGLCPACCALGIIRFSTWANAYGGGCYTAAVNGPAPAYVIKEGRTLQQTFLLNCPETFSLNRNPPWICNAPPGETQLDIVTVFAWRSRRLWLADPEGEKGRCSYCAEEAYLIREHVFTGNWKPPFKTSGNEKKFWLLDPHLVLVEKTQSGGRDDAVSAERHALRKGKPDQLKQTTLGFPSPGAKVATRSRFWRRALSAGLMSKTSGHQGIRTIIAGPAANKGLYQDAASINLPDDCRIEVIETVEEALRKMNGLLRSISPGTDRKHPERMAFLDALSPSLEARLKRELCGCPDTKEVLKDELLPVVLNIISATTIGSPLRRREAMNKARESLRRGIDSLVGRSERLSGTGAPGSVPGEPKSDEQKGDSL